MTDLELETRAADFWSETGLAESYPRNIEQAIALRLPVTIVKLPIVTVRTVGRWLQRRNRHPVFPAYDRDLMGCLYADHGHGFIFVCGADDPDEQRFTLAHDAAHFLVDYWWPRLRVIQTMGSSIRAVLDGHRPVRPDERASAILAGINLSPHWHLLPRQGVDPASDQRIACIEHRADDLGLELVAPLQRVKELIRPIPRRRREDLNTVCSILGSSFGLPPYVFRMAVARVRGGQTATFLDDALRVLRGQQ